MHNLSEVFGCCFDVTCRSVGDLGLRSVDSDINLLLGGTRWIPNLSSGCDLDAVHVHWARRGRMCLFCAPWAQYLMASAEVCPDCPRWSVLGQRKTIPLSLKIIGADVSSCGLSPGTALWLSGVFSGEKSRETAMRRRLVRVLKGRGTKMFHVRLNSRDFL